MTHQSKKIRLSLVVFAVTEAACVPIGSSYYAPFAKGAVVRYAPCGTAFDPDAAFELPGGTSIKAILGSNGDRSEKSFSLVAQVAVGHNVRFLDDVVTVKTNGGTSQPVRIKRITREIHYPTLEISELATDATLFGSSLGVGNAGSTISNALYVARVSFSVSNADEFSIHLPSIELDGRSYDIGPISYVRKFGVRIAGLCQ